MPSVIGKIISFEGAFSIKGLDGSVRKALLGDNIYEGEVLIGDKNNTPLNNIEISISDGSTIVIRGQEKQLFDASLATQEFTKEETITQKDSIEAMLEASGDLEEIQELETAAGEEVVTESSGTAEAAFAELNNASVNVSADLRDRNFLEEYTENIEDFTREDIRRALEDTLVTADPSVTAVNDAPTITVTSVNDFTEDSGNVVGDTVATYTTSDEEGDAVTVTLSDTTNYTLGVGADAGKVLLTQAGLDLVDAGVDLPPFTLTPNDGAVDGTPVTADPSVTAVNDAPTSTDGMINILEDMNNTEDIYTLKISDFGAYSDEENSALAAVRIETLPTNGVLYLNATPISAGTEILATDIEEGRLTFNPTDHSDTDGSFTFSVNDGSLWSSDTYTTTINIEAVADIPLLSLSSDVIVSQIIDIDNVTDTNNGFIVTALDTNGVATTVSTNTHPEGFGVTGIASGADSELGGSEKLIVKFDNLVDSADVSFAWMSSSESAAYTFYKDGVEVGTGLSQFGSDGVEPAETLKPSSGSDFDTIIFSAPYSGDDYLIHSITYDKVESTSGAIVAQEDSSVSLNISSSLVDADGSESLDILLKDIPVGFTISDGNNSFVADESNSSVNITNWTLNSLILTTPNVNETTTYTLNVVATATESSNADTASTTLPIEITVNDNPDLTILNDNTAQVDEAALTTGTNSSSTEEVATGNILSDDTLPAGFVLNDVSIIGGNTTVEDEEITVTTAEGNVLVVNSVTGDYVYTLNNPLNHSVSEDKVDTFIYTVVDSNGVSSSANLAVTILDDSPIIDNTTSVSLSLSEPTDTNIIFTLDVSGSMDTIVSGTNKTRFDIAKEALINTIDTYSDQGNVNVNLTLFNGGAVSLGWKNEAEILNYLSRLTMDHDTNKVLYDGSTIPELTSVKTNYEAALQATSSTYNTGLLAAENTVAYFISDGAPTAENKEGRRSWWKEGSDEESGWLDTSYVDNWTDFINTNSIDLTVIGIGNNISTDYLDKVQVQDSKEAIVVTDATQLSDTITSTIESIEGSLYTTDGQSGINFGADGGHISELTYSGTAYTYDASSPTQTIALSEGSMELNFETGGYIYKPTIYSGNDLTEEFNIIVIDNDGDVKSSDLTLSIGTGETFTFDDATDIDGGVGYDTLLITGNDSIDFSGLDATISNIEALNLGDGAQNITLSVSDVLSMTDENNTLKIDGDSSDHINLDTITDSDPSGDWRSGETVLIDNQEYSRYTGEIGGDSVTLEVSVNIQVDES